MSRLQALWKAAKSGLKIGLGPISVQVRAARNVRVSPHSARPPLARPAAPVGVSAPEVALIVGTGPGLGSALAKRFARAGMQVALAARNTAKLEGVLQTIRETGGAARAYGCDATDERSVKQLLENVTREIGVPHLVVYNVEHFCPGTLLEIETAAFEECWRAMALGGFLVGREAARKMLPRGSGTVIYTGATGALRGRAEYINMAVGKFGVRALAQSMARDLGPKGIHVAHVVLDGGILSERSPPGAGERMSSMHPDQIAEAYYQLHRQHPSTWTQEMDLRPWVEKF
jgi:NAD(P)-dependent dehydrogenase (short-subunit alcohol dehydrogenase family)